MDPSGRPLRGRLEDQLLRRTHLGRRCGLFWRRHGLLCGDDLLGDHGWKCSGQVYASPRCEPTGATKQSSACRSRDARVNYRKAYQYCRPLSLTTSRSPFYKVHKFSDCEQSHNRAADAPLDAPTCQPSTGSSMNRNAIVYVTPLRWVRLATYCEISGDTPDAVMRAAANAMDRRPTLPRRSGRELWSTPRR